jgi:phosphoribosyl 1,2-cyclic phosphate phosphodiesterase
MRVHVLGSGGNTPIPTPTCRCDVCEQAREEGIPYARGGNSLYLPDLAAIVDAPEFVFDALNREEVTDLDYILLTHWHPDHTNGLRVVQSRDMSAHDGLLNAIAEDGPTLLTTETVYDRVCDSFGQVEHYERQGFLDVQFLGSGPVAVGEATVTAIPYALEDEELDATAFVIERAGTTVVIALDDARYLDESELPADIDLAVFECGLFETDPDGAELFTDSDWAFLADELTHEEVLSRIERVDPDRTLLTEIEHLTARSHDHFEQRERQQEYDDIEFAYDGKQTEVG